MLRKLRIINFESHEDTIIEFSDGFNAIIGDSDGGKSSIIRALSAVCYNRWSADMMRVGAHECVIELTTDKGIVTLIKNLKEKVNAYECILFSNNEKIRFETIGTSVPDIVFEITGMRELDLGDTKDTPNVMYQLEKHYMLAEINGKSCTSNLIARVFDRVIGLGGMEELISEISSNMINNKKQITKNNEAIDNLRNKMNSNLEIENKDAKLQKAKLLLDEINELKKIYERVCFYDIEINKLRGRWKNLDNKSISIDTDLAKNILEKLNSLVISYKQIANLFLKYENKINIQNNIDKHIKSLKYIDQNQIDKLKSMCNVLYKMDKLISKFNDKNDSLLKINKCIERYSSEYESFNSELIKIKQESKICPLCGKPFENCGDLNG